MNNICPLMSTSNEKVSCTSKCKFHGDPTYDVNECLILYSYNTFDQILNCLEDLCNDVSAIKAKILKG